MVIVDAKRMEEFYFFHKKKKQKKNNNPQSKFRYNCCCVQGKKFAKWKKKNVIKKGNLYEKCKKKFYKEKDISVTMLHKYLLFFLYILFLLLLLFPTKKILFF